MRTTTIDKRKVKTPECFKSLVWREATKEEKEKVYRFLSLITNGGIGV
jgi:hypothetical protein